MKGSVEKIFNLKKYDIIKIENKRSKTDKRETSLCLKKLFLIYLKKKEIVF